MKFEIEIEESEINALLQRAVRKAIADEGFGMVGSVRTTIRPILTKVLERVVENTVTDMFKKDVEQSVREQAMAILRVSIAKKFTEGKG